MCCLTENDVLFCWKWRVVLLKTTACFFQMVGWSFFSFARLREKWNVELWKYLQQRSLARACTRTHHRSFIVFAVTSVTELFVIRYNTRCYTDFGVYFNKLNSLSVKKWTVKPSKMWILSPIWVQYPPIFPRFFTLSVTLVTAKKQHRCWKACAYACARDCLLALDTFCEKLIDLQCRVALFVVFQRKKCRFLRFFHSLPSFQCLYV